MPARLLLIAVLLTACSRATARAPATAAASPRKVYLLHDGQAGGSGGDPSRTTLVEILQAMGGIVVELRDSPTPASQMRDGALIIIGPNAKMFGANHPDPGLRTIPVPLMVSKDGNTTDVGLGK